MEWFWTSLGSLFATFMFLRSTLMQFLPFEVKNFLHAQIAALLTALRRHTHTIRMHEYAGNQDRNPNELFTAARSHLNNHCTMTAPILLLCKDTFCTTITSSLPASHSITDSFNGITLQWRFNSAEGSSSSNEDYFDLTFHRRYTHTIQPLYIHHLLDEACRRRFETRDRRLFTNNSCSGFRSRYYDDHQYLWSSPVPFSHPSTFDSLALDPALCDGIISDFRRFTARGDYYRRVVRAWKRGYLLYGPPGTGKTSLIAAIANFLKFDVYDIDLTAVTTNIHLRKLFASTATKSIIVIGDIDCSLYLSDRINKSNQPRKIRDENTPEEPKVSLSGVLSFVDGVSSSSVGERLIIFITNHCEKLDPALLRPGRMDRQIFLSHCRPAAFRILAKKYLEVEESHPMMAEDEPLIAELKMTPAEVAEVLLGCADDGADAGMKKAVEVIRRRKAEALVGGDTVMTE